MGLTAKDIVPGKIYRGNSRRRKRSGDGAWDDRQVLWVSSDRYWVQYDGPNVSEGRSFPTVSMDKFLRWVGEE